jgi:hypothetical protein
MLDLGFKDVTYGDRQTFTKVPHLCIEPAVSTHEYEGVPIQQRNTINIAFLIYHTGLHSVDGIQQEADELAKNLADFINLHSTGIPHGGDLLGGLIAIGHVSSREYGYRVLQDRKMRANRLVWTGISKTRLVEAP